MDTCVTNPAATSDELTELEWRARQAAHERRVRAWTDPHQERAARGEKHPVYDFLFTYYGYRPAWLRRWHPGPGVVLSGPGARVFLRWPEYRSVPLDDTGATAGAAERIGIALDTTTLPAHRRDFVRWLRDLLRGMQSRPAFFGCFGLHEWAMVYRQTPEQVRHNQWPLRHRSEQIAAIVERSSICCSHFDAFRFFTSEARPRNRLQPTRGEVPLLEQRGCLHANMDLYKWAYKLAPYTPAELVADCFELARDIREVDMRASPYDLRALGFAPIPVETSDGRAEYETLQRSFTARGEPLRARLIETTDRLLASLA